MIAWSEITQKDGDEDVADNFAQQYVARKNKEHRNTANIVVAIWDEKLRVLTNGYTKHGNDRVQEWIEILMASFKRSWSKKL